MKKFSDFLFWGTVILSFIFLISRFHLVEDDFLELYGIADGIYQKIGYCFTQLNSYSGLAKLTGYTTRPPFIPLFLATGFKLFGKNLWAIFLVYSLPRLLIAPVLYKVANFYFPRIFAYMIATLPFFFPYYDTFAIATLKADVFMVFLSLLSLYFYLQLQKVRTIRLAILLGFFSGLNFLSKETATAFSATLLFLTIINCVKGKKIKLLVPLLLTFFITILPFIIFSLVTTSRFLPSMFTTSWHLASFLPNLETYFLSVVYYLGLPYGWEKSISLVSLGLIALFFCLLGIGMAIYKNKWELVLPPTMVLVGICLMHSRVVQGDLVGNREILHRIAIVVPFTALLIGMGISFFTNFLTRNKKIFFLLSSIILFLLQLGFIYRNFKYPVSLDNNPEDYYINSQIIANFKPQLPKTIFSWDGKYCFNKNLDETKEFLLDYYRPYKIPAFSSSFKKTVLFVWFAPLLFVIINLLICPPRE